MLVKVNLASQEPDYIREISLSPDGSENDVINHLPKDSVARNKFIARQTAAFCLDDF